MKLGFHLSPIVKVSLRWRRGSIPETIIAMEESTLEFSVLWNDQRGFWTKPPKYRKP
jgi:hypothetical protein